jgi:hypothetical protein
MTRSPDFINKGESSNLYSTVRWYKQNKDGDKLGFCRFCQRRESVSGLHRIMYDDEVDYSEDPLTWV